MITSTVHLHDGISLSYTKYGDGTTPIIAFHGFGHPKEDWEFILPFLNDKFYLLAIDVIGHGASTFPSSRFKDAPLYKKEWKMLIEKVLLQEKIEQFHVMGYSLGGRIALVTAELLTDRIASITLFSPDGLHKSLMFKLANETYLGRRLFQYAIDRVNYCIPIVKAFHRLKIISDTKRKFVLYQLENPDRLAKVKIVWASLSLLWPNLQQLYKNQKYEKPTMVIFGEKDPIILPSFGQRLSPFSSPNMKVINAPFGHRTSKKEVIDFLIQRQDWPFL